MQFDPTALAASPGSVTLGGVDYRVPPLRFRDMADFLAYVKELHPDPRAVARRFMEGLPDAVAVHVYDRACEEARNWPPTLDGPEVNEAIATPEGQARLVFLSLRRTVADMTLDRARDIADSMGAEEMARFLEAAMPSPPDDPKAGPPAGGAGAGSTGIASSSTSP